MYYEIDLNRADSLSNISKIQEGDIVRLGKDGKFGDRMIAKRIDGKLVIGQNVNFDRIRRVTGYLTGSLSRFNDAKKAEVKDRVVHMHFPRAFKPVTAANDEQKVVSLLPQLAR